MIQCPYCSESIFDDSLYCDQCGRKINLCPKCQKPGSGRMCGNCGTPMNDVVQVNPAAQVKGGVAQNPFVQHPESVQTSGSAVPAKATPPLNAASASILKLRCSQLAVPFSVQSGAIFGREIPPMSDQKAFDTVSTRHGVFQQTMQGWSFKDVGSTNGTALNGRLMQRERVEQLSDGDTLQMGEVKFNVILK